MGPNLLALGKKVREARRKMGLTQQQLSELISCSPEWISKIERGRASPSLSCIASIGHVLGTDLTLLLDGAKVLDGGQRSAPDLGASLIRSLDADGQDVAIWMLEALVRRQLERDGTTEGQRECN